MFGAWGEASPDFERVLKQFSAKGADVHWRDMQASRPLEARGALAWLLRRRIAMTALRENARLKINRVEFVGRGAAAAIDRRAVAFAGSEAAARRSACSFWQGPRLATGGRGDD